MSAKPPIKAPLPDSWPEQIGRKASRKLRVRADGSPNFWFGLGLLGIVGWTVALPPVLGALLGAWIDQRWPSRYSWTLTLLIVGLVLGCVTTWQWLRKQGRDD